MDGRGDYPGAMNEPFPDDARAEALLRGEATGADPGSAAVAAFVREMRASASGPAPAPSPALAALLGQGAQAPERPPVAVPAARRAPARRGWRRWIAVAGIGTGVALTSVVGAGAAGLLPGPAERVVGEVVETLTPLTLPERGRDHAPVAAGPGGTSGSSRTREGVGRPTPSTTTTTRPAAVVPAGSTSTTLAPSGADDGTGAATTTSTTAPASTTSTAPATTTTVPGLPGVTLPTIPNVGSLPITPPSSLPPLPVTVPRPPW